MNNRWLVFAVLVLGGCGGGGGGPAPGGNPGPGPGPGGGGDRNPPVITNAQVSPQAVGIGDQVTITANVTDSASALANVKANVSLPDQRAMVLDMVNTSGSEYRAGFSAFWNELAALNGELIITVEATDSAGNRTVTPFIRVTAVGSSPPPPPI